MKTLTEFSTLTLRKAAAVRAAARGGRTVTPTELAQAAADDRAASEAAAAAASAEAGGEAEAAEPEGEAPAAEAAPAEGGDAAEAPKADAPPDPAIEAVAAALSVQADRAARLLEA